ncbi:hypothetical protein [Mesorhizobium sp. M6A.T.Cr.TU.016.01.1.1]|uniref:hypothetical protein n=1 Tax=Mesorhizobium sp. M6A.T.Cr.TU.016.01.1.1 TaxID=2493677 RepID=UPI000F75290D|nr:hypothetical protein [Mesorhizobium sp. M6A.T.Cr.TU.016.01.1.1]AZO67682.1 hypothetical protein EJ075_24000 [Mesorhizobium sp. M6A.T.Cr.TU.016.01.1.1]
MSGIPGYDEWKLMTPEEDRESSRGKPCPVCGAYSTEQCEDCDRDSGICPAEETEPDPDDLRDQREENKRLESRP